MDIYYEKVKGYLMELNFVVENENHDDSTMLVTSEEDGIQNLVIGCADPILIIEQHMFDLSNDSSEVFKSLLMKNRDIVHGAFVLDDTGKKVIFRDTLQLENLDLNEIEASINSLSLLLSEYSTELIQFSKN